MGGGDSCLGVMVLAAAAAIRAVAPACAESVFCDLANRGSFSASSRRTFGPACNSICNRRTSVSNSAIRTSCGDYDSKGRPPERTRLQTVQRRLQHLAPHPVEHRLADSQLIADVGNGAIGGERFQDSLSNELLRSLRASQMLQQVRTGRFASSSGHGFFSSLNQASYTAGKCMWPPPPFANDTTCCILRCTISAFSAKDESAGVSRLGTGHAAAGFQGPGLTGLCFPFFSPCRQQRCLRTALRGPPATLPRLWLRRFPSRWKRCRQADRPLRGPYQRRCRAQSCRKRATSFSSTAIRPVT